MMHTIVRLQRKLWRLYLVSLTVLAISGCSTVKLAYNNADWLLLRQANHYLDLDADQEEHLAANIRVRLDQHRRQELPEYVALLKNVRRWSADRLTPQEIDQIIDDLRTLYQYMMLKTVPIIAPVLANLSESQIDHLAHKLNETNQEYREEYLQGTQQERRKARAERIIERIEKWTGSLSHGQTKLLTQQGMTLPDSSGDWYRYRLAQQQKLLALMRQGAGTQAIEIHLTQWWIWQVGQPAELEHKIAALINGTRGLILTLDASMTPQQRRHLRKRVKKLAKQLESLTAPTRLTMLDLSRYEN